jgi:PAS domain S-box-containing protein
MFGPVAYAAFASTLAIVHYALPMEVRGWLVLGSLTAALVSVVVGIAIHRPLVKEFWWLVALSLTVWVVGGSMRVAGDGVIGPWDPLFIVGYTSLLVAVVILGRSTWRRAENLVDTAIVTVAAGGTLLAIFVEPGLRGAGLDGLESLILLCYPLFGALLFAAVLRCAFGSKSRSFSVTALLIGLAAMAVTAALLPSMHLGYLSPPQAVTGVGWLIGYVSIIAAALDPSMKNVLVTDEQIHPAQTMRLVVLGLSIVVFPLGILIATLLNHRLDLLLLAAIAVPLATLIAVRMVMLIKAVERRARVIEDERAMLMIVIRNLPLAIWATDRNGTITFSDGKAISRLGYQPGELVGRDFYHLYAYQPETLEDHRRALEGHASSRTIQFGGVVWEAFISPLHDGNGGIDGILGVALDVTERVRSVEQLAERELLLRQAEKVANIGSWSWDIEKDFVTWSDQQHRIFDTAGPASFPATLDGFLAFVHPDDRDRVKGEVEDGLVSGSFSYLCRIVRGDGEERILDCRGQTVYADGAPIGMFGVSQDVTESHQEVEARKGLEQQLRQTQKMEAVGRLAGGIAHDFNNLLTAIMGHAGLLLGRDDLKADIRDDIREIEEAANAGRDITGALLDIGQRRVVSKRALDLNHSIVSFEPVMRRLIGEDIALILTLCERPVFVAADQGQLEQVLLNLAVNAREAMPGGGTLRIGTEEAHKLPRSADPSIEGPWVLLSFADTGVGIDPSTVHRIFEPFFSTKERGKGAGLGLSIVYGIVIESGGFVDVVSAPRAGTKVRIFLPITSKVEEVVPEFPEVEPDHGPATILLVEDEAAVRTTTQRILSRRGYSVLTAVDGLSALEIATSQIPIDLLITDVVMPNMNGVALAERFRQAQPRSQVIYISGYTDDVLSSSGLSGDRIDFVPKPFRPEELVTKVREVLGRTREERR